MEIELLYNVFMYNVAQVFSAVFLGLFLLVSINQVPCLGLAFSMSAVGLLQYVLELPTVSVYIWGPAAIFLFVYGCFIWWPSKGLLFVFAQLWIRGE